MARTVQIGNNDGRPWHREKDPPHFCALLVADPAAARTFIWRRGRPKWLAAALSAR